MKLIDFKSLQNRLPEIRNDFQLAEKPFRFTVFENFFMPDAAAKIQGEYPAIDNGKWDGTTYIDQKNKFQKTKFESGSIFNQVFPEMNSPEFCSWLEQVTGITEKITGDPDLFGGGLHQSIAGAFLNVHVDYNIHPETKFHRRLNVLVYMNADWKEEYEGYLELWDLADNHKKQVARIAPVFNRCVIFETNEISYHGHPKPLKTPAGVSRKSIATYYYTETKDVAEIAGEHNTLYVNTEGVAGQAKRFTAGVTAFFERILKKNK